MSVRKILFPTDFSHTGDGALELATSLARKRGATLLIVHVEEPPAAYGGGEMYYGMPDPATEDLREMLQRVIPSDREVGFEHHLVTGDPANVIARLAEQEGVELVVMGKHGRTGLARILMGSVAEAVVRRAPCPVLTLRQRHNLQEQDEGEEPRKRKILFPTDFSHTGDAALKMASSVAGDWDATLLIIHVEEPAMDYGGEMYYGMIEPATEDLTKMLHDVAPADPLVRCEHRLLAGDPTAVIPGFAEEEGVELIVMGTHGRTGLMRLLMGSVAEAVVRRARCPVLTYKQPSNPPTGSPSDE